MSFERCHLLPPAATNCNTATAAAAAATFAPFSSLNGVDFNILRIKFAFAASASSRASAHSAAAAGQRGVCSTSPQVCYLQLITSHRPKDVIKTFKLHFKFFTKFFSLMKIVKRKAGKLSEYKRKLAKKNTHTELRA